MVVVDSLTRRNRRGGMVAHVRPDARRGRDKDFVLNPFEDHRTPSSSVTLGVRNDRRMHRFCKMMVNLAITRRG